MEHFLVQNPTFLVGFQSKQLSSSSIFRKILMRMLNENVYCHLASNSTWWKFVSVTNHWQIDTSVPAPVPPTSDHPVSFTCKRNLSSFHELYEKLLDCTPGWEYPLKFCQGSASLPSMLQIYGFTGLLFLTFFPSLCCKQYARHFCQLRLLCCSEAHPHPEGIVSVAWLDFH